MFEKEIKELFDLCWAVHQETSAHVSFNMGKGILCSIYVWDEGLITVGKCDGDYMLYEQKILREVTQDNYIKAKAHLERLLREKGKVSRNENDN